MSFLKKDSSGSNMNAYQVIIYKMLYLLQKQLEIIFKATRNEEVLKKLGELKCFDPKRNGFKSLFTLLLKGIRDLENIRLCNPIFSYALKDLAKHFRIPKNKSRSSSHCFFPSRISLGSLNGTLKFTAPDFDNSFGKESKESYESRNPNLNLNFNLNQSKKERKINLMRKRDNSNVN